ncbi:hypothetical protein EGW08_015110, partial [Elysia chlorotica]
VCVCPRPQPVSSRGPRLYQVLSVDLDLVWLASPSLWSECEAFQISSYNSTACFCVHKCIRTHFASTRARASQPLDHREESLVQQRIMSRYQQALNMAVQRATNVVYHQYSH